MLQQKSIRNNHQKFQTTECRTQKKKKSALKYNKSTHFADWYLEIVTKCDLIEKTEIKGCYVLKPLTMFIWNEIKNHMNQTITSLDVEEEYFPLFASENALRLESTFFDGFTAEVAWVTHGGKNKLKHKIAVRPTSETIIYPHFKTRINSYRDLPIKMNQWCNTVRWEFDDPKPFLQSREFLWQEGHTAYADKKEAEKEVDVILDLYANVYHELCAVPVIKGTKTRIETFPGADYTKTVECYIGGSGRAIQGATSHHLGQRFSNDKAFDIWYLNENMERDYVYQNSWGLSTRTIGAMVLSHSDHYGLVIPPKLAKIQIVIVAINNDRVLVDKCMEIQHRLKCNEFRVKFDNREDKGFGFKCTESELKGIPIRIEIGYEEIKNDECTISRRDLIENGEKFKLKIDDYFENEISNLLDKMQNDLYLKAKKKLSEGRKTVYDWKEFLEQVQNGNIVDAPHCMETECEELILIESKEYFVSQPDINGVGSTGKAKALCIPDEQNEITSQTLCVRCKSKAKKWILFGRSY